MRSANETTATQSHALTIRSTVLVLGKVLVLGLVKYFMGNLLHWTLFLDLQLVYGASIYEKEMLYTTVQYKQIKMFTVFSLNL